MAETVTIDLSAEGVTTAAQLRGLLQQQLTDAQTARTRLITNQQQELGALDGRITLIRARIGELDEFITFKGASGG